MLIARTNRVGRRLVNGILRPTMRSRCNSCYNVFTDLEKSHTYGVYPRSSGANDAYCSTCINASLRDPIKYAHVPFKTPLHLYAFHGNDACTGIMEIRDIAKKKMMGKVDALYLLERCRDQYARINNICSNLGSGIDVAYLQTVDLHAISEDWQSYLQLAFIIKCRREEVHMSIERIERAKASVPVPKVMMFPIKSVTTDTTNEQMEGTVQVFYRIRQTLEGHLKYFLPFIRKHFKEYDRDLHGVEYLSTTDVIKLSGINMDVSAWAGMVIDTKTFLTFLKEETFYYKYLHGVFCDNTTGLVPLSYPPDGLPLLATEKLESFLTENSMPHYAFDLPDPTDLF